VCYSGGGGQGEGGGGHGEVGVGGGGVGGSGDSPGLSPRAHSSFLDKWGQRRLIYTEDKQLGRL
jgi:hypothetical protein